MCSAREGEHRFHPGHEAQGQRSPAGSRDDSAFNVLTNERDPRFFDVYRYELEKLDQVLDLQRHGRLSRSPTSPATAGGWRSASRSTTSDADIYVWDTRDSRMIHVTPHKIPAQYSASEFDPDSKWLYYLTNAGGEFTRVRRYELATGKHEDVESADWDIAFTRFSRNGRYRVSAVNEDGRTVDPRHDTKTGRLVPMPKLPEGDVTSVVFSRDEERMVVTLNGDRSPSNLYACRVGSAEATRLTDSLSKEIDPADLVESQVVRFKSSDGLSIPSIFYKPHQASPENKVPALVWVHGGPGGQTRKGYSAFIQYLVNHGYAVLGINNRGSSGYGQTFFTADDRKHGREPLRDCVEAKAFLAAMPDIDPEPHRHHRRQLRRLHGAGGAGVPARGVCRRRRHLRRVELAAHAGEHPPLLGSPAPGALSGDRRSREGPRDAQGHLAGLPRRQDPPAALGPSGPERPAGHQARVRRHRRRREEERGAGRVRRLPRRGPRLHQEEEPDRRLFGRAEVSRQAPQRSQTAAGGSMMCY